MEILSVFESTPWLFYTATLLLGLCVGSFLNVVIYRLPVILERDWRIQCHDYLELDDAKIDDKLQQLSLSKPGSSCPQISAFHRQQQSPARSGCLRYP